MSAKKYDAAAIAANKAARAANKTCCNCGVSPTVAKDRCNACYTHLKRKGCERQLPPGWVAPGSSAADAPPAPTMVDHRGRPVDEKGRPIATDPRAASAPIRITRKVMAETLGVERSPERDPFREQTELSTTWLILRNERGFLNPYNAAHTAYNRMLIVRGGYVEVARVEAADYHEATKELMKLEAAAKAAEAPPQAETLQPKPAASKRKAS